MDKFSFMSLVSAVIAANMITVLGLYGIYHLNRAERDGTEDDLGWSAYAMAITPFLIAGAGFFVALN